MSRAPGSPAATTKGVTMLTSTHFAGAADLRHPASGE